mmetsp:Transcript_11601/g.29342  ORF Transcript_11601/g.29342 Transcript_11601/m.29342 type:complete len:264 (+) Transcript_11601:1021-1812(+)
MAGPRAVCTGAAAAATTTRGRSSVSGRRPANPSLGKTAVATEPTSRAPPRGSTSSHRRRAPRTSRSSPPTPTSTTATRRAQSCCSPQSASRGRTARCRPPTTLHPPTSSRGRTTGARGRIPTPGAARRALRGRATCTTSRRGRWTSSCGTTGTWSFWWPPEMTETTLRPRTSTARRSAMDCIPSALRQRLRTALPSARRSRAASPRLRAGVGSVAASITRRTFRAAATRSTAASSRRCWRPARTLSQPGIWLHRATPLARLRP